MPASDVGNGHGLRQEGSRWASVQSPDSRPLGVHGAWAMVARPFKQGAYGWSTGTCRHGGGRGQDVEPEQVVRAWRVGSGWWMGDGVWWMGPSCRCRVGTLSVSHVVRAGRQTGKGRGWLATSRLCLQFSPRRSSTSTSSRCKCRCRCRCRCG